MPSEGFVKDLIRLIHYIVIKFAEMLELKTCRADVIEWFILDLLLAIDFLLYIGEVIAIIAVLNAFFVL